MPTDTIPVVNRHALRALRRAAGLTQTELARRTACQSSYLSRIEAGHRMPSLPLAARIARELRVPIEALLAIGTPAAETK